MGYVGGKIVKKITLVGSLILQKKTKKNISDIIKSHVEIVRENDGYMFFSKKIGLFLQEIPDRNSRKSCKDIISVI